MKPPHLLSVLLVHALLCTGLTYAQCPDRNVCTCTDVMLECLCKHDETITIPFHVTPDIRIVRVHNCSEVLVPFSVFSHFAISEISFVNLTLLDIRPFALMYTTGIKSLQIRDVSELVISPFGFHGVVEVGTITIENVRISSLDTSTLTDISKIENFIIKDSKIDVVNSFAFLAENSTNFQMVNTTIDMLHNSSVTFQGFYNITFINCDFRHMQNGSINVTSASYLTFRDCKLGELETKFLITSDLKYFDFQSNTIDHLNEGAFWGLDVAERIVFTTNKIDQADIDSLIPNKGSVNWDSIEVDVKDNAFFCDCRLKWLWDDVVYLNLLRDSHCYYQSMNASGKTLETLTSLAQNDGVSGCEEVAVQLPTTPRPDYLTTSKKHLFVSANVSSGLGDDQRANGSCKIIKAGLFMQFLIFIVLACIQYCGMQCN